MSARSARVRKPAPVYGNMTSSDQAFGSDDEEYGDELVVDADADECGSDDFGEEGSESARGGSESEESEDAGESGSEDDFEPSSKTKSKAKPKTAPKSKSESEAKGTTNKLKSEAAKKPTKPLPRSNAPPASKGSSTRSTSTPDVGKGKGKAKPAVLSQKGAKKREPDSTSGKKVAESGSEAEERVDEDKGKGKKPTVTKKIPAKDKKEDTAALTEDDRGPSDHPEDGNSPASTTAHEASDDESDIKPKAASKTVKLASGPAAAATTESKKDKASLLPAAASSKKAEKPTEVKAGRKKNNVVLPPTSTSTSAPDSKSIATKKGKFTPLLPKKKDEAHTDKAGPKPKVGPSKKGATTKVDADKGKGAKGVKQAARKENRDEASDREQDLASEGAEDHSQVSEADIDMASKEIASPDVTDIDNDASEVQNASTAATRGSEPSTSSPSKTRNIIDIGLSKTGYIKSNGKGTSPVKGSQESAEPAPSKKRNGPTAKKNQKSSKRPKWEPSEQEAENEGPVNLSSSVPTSRDAASEQTKSPKGAKTERDGSASQGGKAVDDHVQVDEEIQSEVIIGKLARSQTPVSNDDATEDMVDEGLQDGHEGSQESQLVLGASQMTAEDEAGTNQEDDKSQQDHRPSQNTQQSQKRKRSPSTPCPAARAPKKPAPAQKIPPATRAAIISAFLHPAYLKSLPFTSIEDGSHKAAELSRHWREVLGPDLCSFFAGKGGGRKAKSSPGKNAIDQAVRAKIWDVAWRQYEKAEWKGIEEESGISVTKLKRHLRDVMVREAIKFIQS